MRPDYLDAVRAQPDNLIRSRGVVSEALESLRLPPLVLAFGMGASAHAATGFAAALQPDYPAVALSAAEPPPPGAGSYLAISQSGRSRETVAALATVSGAPRLALTNDPASPIAEVADVVLPLGCAEDSRVSTLSYTATIQALGLIADRLLGRPTQHWSAVPAAVEDALALDVTAAVDALAGVDSVDVVGAGVHAASAGAAGLLLREAAHRPTATYVTREYLHGALEPAGSGRGALIFGAGREAGLAADLADYGSSVVLVTADAGEPPSHPRLCVIKVPDLPGLAGCLTDIVPVQLVAAGLAERAGIAIALRHMPDDTKLP
jgi:glucosamine--fructose-6-phosphate aminotransferase (isomerizing)